MDKKTISILVGLALLVSFFLPYMAFGSRTASGLDIVKNAGESRDLLLTYIWLIFPISGIMLLIGALSGNYPGGRALWCWLPLLALIYILIIYPMTKGVSVGDVFKSFGQGFGIGLWIALAASLLGVIIMPRR